MRTLEACPEKIRRVIAEVAAEPAAHSVWLIGSQANGDPRPDSDWDILVFSADEARATKERCAGLDVIRIGPSGYGSLEGHSIIISFATFCWSVIDRETATYVGLDFAPGKPVDRPARRALLLYDNA